MPEPETTDVEPDELADDATDPDQPHIINGTAVLHATTHNGGE